MSLLKEGFISSQLYNSLPSISEVATVPDSHRQDREDLCALLKKHYLPEGVSVRLIHKHFDALDGEIMVIRSVEVDKLGNVLVMEPAAGPRHQLRGIHYMVDDTGRLQPYEYTPDEGPDLTKYPAFLAEFVQMIDARGLKRMWGLASKVRKDKETYQEFEVPSKRSTIMIPERLAPAPGEGAMKVITDWGHSGTLEARVPGPFGPMADVCVTTSSGNHKSVPTGKYVIVNDEHYNVPDESTSTTGICLLDTDDVHVNIPAGTCVTVDDEHDEVPAAVESGEGAEIIFGGIKLERTSPFYSLLRRALSAM